MKYLLLIYLACATSACQTPEQRAAWAQAFQQQGAAMQQQSQQGYLTTQDQQLMQWNSNQQQRAPTQVDYNCLNRCTATGSTYGYCQNACSY